MINWPTWTNLDTSFDADAIACVQVTPAAAATFLIVALAASTATTS